jgi:hypothetical protein
MWNKGSVLLLAQIGIGELFCLTYFAAPGDVASKVILEKKTESVIAFYKGATDFYLGYVTLKVLLPDLTETWN